MDTQLVSELRPVREVRCVQVADELESSVTYLHKHPEDLKANQAFGKDVCLALVLDCACLNLKKMTCIGESFHCIWSKSAELLSRDVGNEYSLGISGATCHEATHHNVVSCDKIVLWVFFLSCSTGLAD
jgi:hypothetical protein